MSDEKAIDCDKLISMSASGPMYLPKATIIPTASIAQISQLVLPANDWRGGLVIYNNGANTVYIAFDTVCSSATRMTLQIATFTAWVMPLPIYTGPISAIRNAGSGILLITEMERVKGY
jgi:hypothetical protein